MINEESEKGWSKKDRAAGEKVRQAWEDFFSASSADETPQRTGPLDQGEQSRISAVRARHESELLGRPHVVGVSEGVRTRHGKPTGEPCLVVYVDRKIPDAELEPEAVLPREIENIPVDVVEIGKVEPLLPK